MLSQNGETGLKITAHSMAGERIPFAQHRRQIAPELRAAPAQCFKHQQSQARMHAKPVQLRPDRSQATFGCQQPQGCQLQLCLIHGGFRRWIKPGQLFAEA